MGVALRAQLNKFVLFFHHKNKILYSFDLQKLFIIERRIDQNVPFRTTKQNAINISFPNFGWKNPLGFAYPDFLIGILAFIAGMMFIEAEIPDGRPF